MNTLSYCCMKAKYVATNFEDSAAFFQKRFKDCAPQGIHISNVLCLL